MTTGQQGERRANRPQRDLRRRTGPGSRLLHPDAGPASPRSVHPETNRVRPLMHYDERLLRPLALPGPAVTL